MACSGLRRLSFVVPPLHLPFRCHCLCFHVAAQVLIGSSDVRISFLAEGRGTRLVVYERR